MILTVARTTAVVALAGLAACGSDAGGETADAYVVATTGIWADLTGRVACDGSLDIRTIVPAGGDPHSFEPSLRDRETLDGATLVVTNGLGLEETLEDTLDSAEDGGVPVFRAGDHVETLQGDDEHADEGEHADEHADEADHAADDEHAHEGADPHIWLDPTRVAAALPALGTALVEAGADQDVIDGCVATAQADLAALDEELSAILAAVPDERRLLVTNHDALGYLADRYGFEIVGTVLPSTSTLTEASPGELEKLAEAIEAAAVPAIFTERFSDSTDAAALAERLGVDVVELHSDALGEPGSGADTYDGLLRSDATSIATALSG